MFYWSSFLFPVDLVFSSMVWKGVMQPQLAIAG